jgi:hypothetical protein
MMAHYAKVEDGVVTSVLVVPDEHEHDGEAYLNSLGLEGRWIQTSYNTYGNVHYGPDGKPDGGVALRYNYAGLGFLYNEARDAFVEPEPEPLKDGVWVFDEETLVWQFFKDVE